jgi:TPR repeat protein
MTVINFPQDQAAVIAMSEQMADNGDGDVAHWLGGVYLKGVGAIPANPQKCVSWVSKAAAAGLAVGQFDLGWFYCHGMHGLPIDVPRGIQLCETAATNGFADAWLALGLMHAEGEIIPKDLSKGVAYMRRGAEAGDKHAQLTLGGCYTYGDYGVKVDKFEGFKWISMAYSNGNEQAFVFLSNAYAYGLGVERNVFKAIHFALAAVDIGDERGDAIIAAIKPVDESPESPGDGDLSKIRADAEKGDARSQYLLARAYYYGKGFEKDLTKALFWADKSAAQNYPDAANLISVYYYNGEDTKKNFVESEKWLKKAVALGSLKAMYNMSLRCHDGTGMKRDDALANQLARAAAVCGYAPAQLLYGRYLVEGIGVAQNLEQAKEWIQAAADNGYRPAQQIIRKNEEADSPSPARNWH